ncbi:MAG TPA: LysR family transcriptional regulator [Tepidisphaeraceae bacterium]|jgi:DNA-binding transcriptional LysR family regulator|nr:LysR family transcriptional regulator [Tepidisphaeraceae bacterium]
MPREIPSISTDQIIAFAELARCGSLRLAAEAMHISEQGVRNRLLALEQRLGAELYRKSRGPRRATPLTPAGQEFLPPAQAFLERARELGELFSGARAPREVHVAASQYLLTYVLIDAVRRFHKTHPLLRIRLSTHSEREIEQVLLSDPAVTLGVAAPYEPASELQYQHIFSMDWSVIAPPRHPLLRNLRVRLRDVAGESLILFERGSTGRQHILDAFAAHGLVPRIGMETTTTETVVRMVEAGFGVAIVPLLNSGVVTRGKKVGVRPLVEKIRPIQSGILTRRGELISDAAREFVEFVKGGAGGGDA